MKCRTIIFHAQTNNKNQKTNLLNPACLHLTMTSLFSCLLSGPNTLSTTHTPCLYIFTSRARVNTSAPACCTDFSQPPADGPHPPVHTHAGTWDAGEILPCARHSVRKHMHTLETQMRRHVCKRHVTALAQTHVAARR